MYVLRDIIQSTRQTWNMQMYTIQLMKWMNTHTVLFHYKLYCCIFLCKAHWTAWCKKWPVQIKLPLLALPYANICNILITDSSLVWHIVFKRLFQSRLLLHSWNTTKCLPSWETPPANPSTVGVWIQHHRLWEPPSYPRAVTFLRRRAVATATKTHRPRACKLMIIFILIDWSSQCIIQSRKCHRKYYGSTDPWFIASSTLYSLLDNFSNIDIPTFVFGIASTAVRVC